MKQPENQSKSYNTLFNDIDEGRIKIPQFQRDFVWEKVQTAALIDSILKGFPIGTFILWKTRERLRHIRNIANFELKEPPSGDAVQYVLDGQQRITSLFAVRKGVRISRDGQEIDYKDIVIDLTIDPSDEEEVVFDQPIKGHNCISVFELLNNTPSQLVNSHRDLIDLISDYQSRLERYQFSTVVIDNYPIDVACEVFTRINTGGKVLSLFEIMVAKTFDRENFDLAERYERLISPDESRNLESVGYGDIPAETVLYCISAITARSIKRADVLKIDKESFIGSYEPTIDGLFLCIDYLRSHMGVTVSRILPYNALLIPLTFFFSECKHTISRNEDTLLQQYFFWASVTHRFQSGAGAKIVEDLEKMERILKGESPHYEEHELSVSPSELERREFRVGDAFCKAVVCLLAKNGPCRLNTDGKIILDNSYLKTSSSRNYHHFFPRAFLKKQGYDSSRSNSLMNIVLIDDQLNKAVIRAKAPSEYVVKFRESNPKLPKALHTHYIGNPDRMGIMEDDYPRFLKRRAKKVAKALNSVLNPCLRQ